MERVHRLLVWSLVPIVISVGLAACGGRGAMGKPTLAPLKIEQGAAVPVGQETKICGTEFTINKTDRQKSKGPGGKDLLIANLSLKNLGTTEYTIVPYEIYLGDSSGKTTRPAFDPVDSPLPSGALKGGQTFTGNISYNVAPEATDLRIIWLPGWCSEKVAVQVPES